MSEAPFFDLRAVHRFEGGFSLDISLQSTHQAIGLVGPSGSGKTTLLHILAGIQAADLAELHVGARALSACPPWARGVGLVVQDAMLFPLLDVRANLRFGEDRGAGRMALDEVVQCLEIGHLLERPVRNLSGGEKQRVALGRALMSAPELLLLDEPFASLDPPRRSRMVERLRDIRQTWKIPMVLVSHNPQDMASLVDEVFSLTEGRIAAPAP